MALMMIMIYRGIQSQSVLISVTDGIVLLSCVYLTHAKLQGICIVMPQIYGCLNSLDWTTGLDYWKKWLPDCTCSEFIRPSFIQAAIAPDNLIGIYS